MISKNPAPIHKHEVLRGVDSSGTGVHAKLGSGGTGSSVPSSCTLGAFVVVDDGLGTTGARVGLLVDDGVGVGVTGSGGVGVSPSAGDVDVGETVGPALVGVAVPILSVGRSVGTGEGEIEGTGTGVSEGSPGGLVGLLVGGSAVGPAVGGVVGTPDGVSVGMV